MNTGEGDIGSLGRIETWQGRDKTDAFEGECGKVRRMIKHVCQCKQVTFILM